MSQPTVGEIEVGLYAVPFACVEFTIREEIKRRTARYGNICNDKARVVSRKSIMNGLGKNTESIVEEKN